MASQIDEPPQKERVRHLTRSFCVRFGARGHDYDSCVGLFLLFRLCYFGYIKKEKERKPIPFLFFAIKLWISFPQAGIHNSSLCSGSCLIGRYGKLCNDQLNA